MPLSCPESARLAQFVRRSPWTAADALVGSLGFEKSGSGGTRAGQGVCPTTASESPVSGKLSGIGMSSCVRVANARCFAPIGNRRAG